jgi:glycosyltransferase involved in cell wall biosynthesis
MNVTVAIPTTLESRLVRRTVESALKSAALCGADSEVLVAVNGATDGDQLAGLASPQLRVLRLSRRSAPGARNAALAAARNDTVLSPTTTALCHPPAPARTPCRIADHQRLD